MTLNKTGIETADFTWNLYTGCIRGCSFCYARKLARGRLKRLYQGNMYTSPLVPDGADTSDPFFPRFWSERIRDPYRVPKTFRSKNPYLERGKAMIFAIDMGDIFGSLIPDEWIRELFEIIEDCSHIFQILTKYPGNLESWAQVYGLPENVWAGVTVCNQSMVDSALSCLSQINATVKYLCLEPLQESIELDLTSIDWIIIGAQTNPLILPKKSWVIELLREANKCDTQIFLKKSLMWKPEIHQWPKRLQEAHR